MIKPNPFTPQSGREPKAFGGRKNQLESFIKIMEEAVAERPDHMVILGEWGTGKTVLLKQFKKIAQERGYLASLCSISKFTEKDTTQSGINLMLEEMVRGFPKIKNIKRISESLESVGISIAGFGAQATKKSTDLQPQTCLMESLLSIWKSLNTKLAVVLIDDVQNFLGIFQVIDILRSVLSKEEIIQDTKYLFVLSSTPDGWSTFLDKHDPIGRFFRKRESLNCLDETETLETIDEILHNTGVSFSQQIKKLIYKNTLGHPYELQILCSNLYASQLKGKVNKTEWNQALQNALLELGQDYFEALYRKASRREKSVLLILAKAKSDLSINNTIEKVASEFNNFPLSNVKNYLYRLKDKGLVKKGAEKRYKILDPMFKQYILLREST